MKKKILIIVLIIILITICGIIFYNYINKSKVDSEGIPYIYIEWNNLKIRAVRYDAYEAIFNEFFSDNEDEYKMYSVNEFYHMFELNTSSVLEYEADDVIYFDVYSSDKSEFNIEGVMNLSCTKDAISMGISGESEESIFKDKESENLIKVGFTKSLTDVKENQDVIKVMKINFKEYGVHYYSVIVNKSQENQEAESETTATTDRIVMINGKLYYDTGKETKMTAKCGTMDGKITSNVSIEEIPTINNQSNFSGNYEYQIASESFVIVNIDNKWIVFQARN